MTTRELYAKIIAESELLQPALNEIHTFCFQHWSRGRGTCGTGSGAPVSGARSGSPQLSVVRRSVNQGDTLLTRNIAHADYQRVGRLSM